MKLPMQAAAILRSSGLIGRSVWPAIGPSDCKTCKHGPNPCKGGYILCSCDSGSCQCCPSNSCSKASGGACACT